ncbi:MAG TPA: sugar ABC transporter ATP-binding protein [Anaerolineae bacterium]|nr:sugar ABC transporter ATP-binding protein [Anaerolineae bacterium]
MESKHTLEMKGISIEFPGVKALDHVDFAVKSGEIHALVGANGAGKSTLMKILGGAYEHYVGEIFFDGKQVDIRTPHDAKELGIDVVYQEVDTALIPYLTVAENIMLDVMANEMKGEHFIRWGHIHRRAREVMKLVGIDLDTHKLVQDLSLAEKQMVLIARALATNTNLLVLDEPTAPLSQTETEELFRLMRDLSKNQNVGIVFISHRLPEIFEICETITILRDGQVVAETTVDQLTQQKLVELMLGQRFEETYPKTHVTIGDVIFEVKNLNEEYGRVRDVSFTVRAGEIIGVTGLVGAGKTELCKTLFGVYPVKSGEILLHGEPMTIKSPHAAVKQHVALVPEERRKEGVLVDEPAFVNLTLPSLDRFTKRLAFVDTRAERTEARKVIQDLGIRTPSENQKVAYLSGGNQQKVAVGKWLIADAEIYIFDEPTKGVDVGAKHDIFELIGELAKRGKGIIYASSEIPEILDISDRIYVMYDYTIVKEFKTSEATEEAILYYSAGGQ